MKESLVVLWRISFIRWRRTLPFRAVASWLLLLLGTFSYVREVTVQDVPVAGGAAVFGAVVIGMAAAVSLSPLVRPRVASMLGHRHDEGVHCPYEGLPIRILAIFSSAGIGMAVGASVMRIVGQWDVVPDWLMARNTPTGLVLACGLLVLVAWPFARATGLGLLRQALTGRCRR